MQDFHHEKEPFAIIETNCLGTFLVVEAKIDRERKISSCELPYKHQLLTHLSAQIAGSVTERSQDPSSLRVL